MKKVILILAALMSGASLSAQSPAASRSYSVTADFSYSSKYVFRGVEYAKGSLQPSIKVTSGNFYARIWGNTPLDQGKGYELEVDYTVGYGFKLAKSWALDVGLTAYSYPKLDISGVDSTTWEGFVGINGTIGSVSTGTYAYYDETMETFTIQEAIGYSIQVTDKISVNLLATIGHVSPTSGSDYTYYGFGATVPYKLNDTAILTAGAQYADHNITSLKGGHFWGTLGLTVEF